MPEDFGFEAARLLHNYLARLAALRDVQRVIHRQVWPELNAPDSDDKRTTKWEVEVWAPKINKLFDDEPTVFLVDLRNYSMHYGYRSTGPQNGSPSHCL